MRLLRLVAGAIVAVGLGLVALVAVAAQGPDVGIAELQCGGDPELVVLENQGDASQTLVGWELQSDPSDSEVFDLSQVGGLEPGATVTIRSGPAASGVFIWSQEFVFRDDDPTDFAQIVDDQDSVVEQVACAAAPEPTPTATAEPTPTSTATSTPEPTPESMPVNGVPNGGGPPPAGGLLSPAMTILTGGSLAAAGLATLVWPWSRLRNGSGAGPSSPGASAVRRGLQGQRAGTVRLRGVVSPGGLVLALVAVTVAALLVLLRDDE